MPSPGTIDATLAKMKKRVIGEDGIRYMLSADEVLSFLNSIEVAIKRERALLDANVNRVRELEAMLDGAANTVLGCAIKQKQSATGSAAETRKALSDACYAMHNFLKTQNGGYEEMAIALDKAKAALAAPPEPPCNAAVTREALMKAKLYFDHRGEGTNLDDAGMAIDAITSIDAALAAHARNCDVGKADDLHASFVRHCDACNPPGGCCHRKDTRRMLDTNCASILKCFARFAIANKEGDKK